MQQVIIGLDTTEMVSEMELIGQLESDFDMEEIDDEDSGSDDDDDDDNDEDEDDDSGGYENVMVSFLYLFFSHIKNGYYNRYLSCLHFIGMGFASRR